MKIFALLTIVYFGFSFIFGEEVNVEEEEYGIEADRCSLDENPDLVVATEKLEECIEAPLDGQDFCEQLTSGDMFSCFQVAYLASSNTNCVTSLVADKVMTAVASGTIFCYQAKEIFAAFQETMPRVNMESEEFYEQFPVAFNQFIELLRARYNPIRSDY